MSRKADSLALHDETKRPPIDTLTIKKAAHIIDQSDLPRLLTLWQSQDRSYKGGREAFISMRTVLIVWLILAMEQQPMHCTRVTLVLLERLTPKTAAILGYEMNAFTRPEAIYDRARSATTRIFDLVDAEPLRNRHRRLTVAEYRDELKWREDNADIIEKRRRRREILQNSILEATYKMLPVKYRPKKISLAIDATRLKTHARGIGKERLAALPDHARVSSEPDAGFYLRTKKGTLPKQGEQVRIIEYAQEAEFAVTGSNGGKATAGDVPNLVVGFTMHIPSAEPAANARRLVDNLWERGHTIEHLATDRAYMPAGDAELLQIPLRRAGVKLLMDYPKDELGIQGYKHGAILIEGTWYDPHTPEDAIHATKYYREGIENLDKLPLTKDERKQRERDLESLWRARLATRSTYRFREKGAMKPNGNIPFKCGAAGPNPLLKCTLKPDVVDTRKDGRALLQLAPDPKHMPAVCQNLHSTTFNVADSGRHGQHYEYQSEEWANHYHHLRNNVESANGFVKNASGYSLADPGRFRMRGATAKSILVVIAVAAANLTKIRQFLEHKAEQALEGQDEVPVIDERSRRQRKTPARTRLTHRQTRRRNSGDRDAPPKSKTQLRI